MRRAWRWIWRLLVGLLALAVVGITVVVIALHTDWGRDLVRRRIVAALQRSFPGSTIGRLTGSVFGTVVAHDVELVGLDHRPIATIATLDIDLALWPLLGHTARVERIVADGVTAYPRTLPPVPDDHAGPTPWNVELVQVSVHHATVKSDAGVTVLDVDVRASATIPSGGPITAIATFGGRWTDRTFGGIAAMTVGDDVAIPFATAGAGGAWVIASGAAIEARRGHLVAALPAADLARLAPRAPVRGDARVSLTAAARGADTQLVISGFVGATPLSAVVLGDPVTRRARGVIGVTGAELASVTGDRVRGLGTAVIAATIEGTHASGTVIAGGVVDGYPAGHAVIAVDGTLDGGEVLVLATGEGDARIGAIGHAHRVGRDLQVDDARVGAWVADLDTASLGHAPVHGALAAEIAASGPVTALDVKGKVAGTKVRYERMAVVSAKGRFHVVLDDQRLGTAHVELGGVVNAGKPVGSAVIDAYNRVDGRIVVDAVGHPARAPIVGRIHGVVTPGTVTEIALGGHRLETPRGVWSGSGGHVRIDRRTITVRDVLTRQGDAWAKLEASLGRTTDALTVSLEAHAIPAAVARPGALGTVSGAGTLERARARWSGTGMLSGTGLALGADTRAIDAGANVTIEGRRVTVAVNASNSTLGGARASLEVEGPSNLIDPDAWLRVARGDLHAVTIGVDKVDLAAISRGKTEGQIDGTLSIREGVPSGALHVRGVPTPVGEARADVTLALTEVGFVDANANATIDEVGAATGSARIAIPDHPFSPAAWKALGTKVAHGATAEANNITFGPKLLSLLHVDAPLRGTASVKLDLGAGASSATVAVDVHDLIGGPLLHGLDVHLDGTADASGTRAALRVRAGALTLLDLPNAATPVTLERWLTAARGAVTAPVSGTVVIGQVEAKDALALVGRTDVTSGTVAGRAKIGGTIGTPTGTATLDLHGIHVTPQFASKAPPALELLHVDAGWGGAGGHVTITGNEAGSGTLFVDVRGRPDQLASLDGRVTIENFDLAPVVVFLPGPLAGASGTLKTDLTIRGLDPSTGSVRGTLHLRDGRLPIAPAIGTLRKADVQLALTDLGITGSIDGRLGAGTIKVKATSGADGVETTLDAWLTKVSPIGALQPILDATLHGTFHRERLAWRGKLTVSKTSIVVPEQTGHELLDAAAPTDLIFVDLPVPHLPIAAAAPLHPWLVAEVDVKPVTITVPEFAVDAVAGGKVTVSVGETVGLDGEMRVERGSADLFGHRYRVELGQLVFDGTTDGLLDLKLAHDFSDATTFVRFAGRLSALAGQEPEFSSEPGVYSQGQLLGFFLGGEPGGDPAKQTKEAAAGFGASLASTKIGRRLKHYLPVSLDVLRCDPGAGQSGASCTLGKWVTEKIFLSYKQNLQARYDENTGDAALEWHWRPNWQLELSGGDRHYYGSDLLWRYRW